MVKLQIYWKGNVCIVLYLCIIICFVQDVVLRLHKKWRNQLSVEDQVWMAKALFTGSGQLVTDPHLWYHPPEYKPSGFSPPRVSDCDFAHLIRLTKNTPSIICAIFYVVLLFRSFIFSEICVKTHIVFLLKCRKVSCD